MGAGTEVAAITSDEVQLNPGKLYATTKRLLYLRLPDAEQLRPNWKRCAPSYFTPEPDYAASL